ncbi:PilW family protein [Allobacillus sp. GCM10007491]|uniref:Prepilin-type N-terminal cleavage/methylation domain-containing protein n=1 Tax=Allobacillus saliphilus TaxID=2912308 RepID=A0A941HUJ2_9BACI|nr:prepilin-type N-terminal cleavage/methylation domain-containing protein [Allobacillus saliphilus]MBR7554439.1 prepilin-type N-terminal cleavage/methylation domain-containing protein [Allobacillus saliphilus]
MKNQKGITLVELLAGLVLFFLVSTLIFSIATQAIENYRQTETRSIAQQEANLFINHLISVHRTADFYTLTRNDDSSYLVTRNGEDSFTISTTPYRIDVSLNHTALQQGESIQINLSTQQSVPLQVTVVPLNDQRFKTFSIDTQLYRISPNSDSRDE